MLGNGILYDVTSQQSLEEADCCEVRSLAECANRGRDAYVGAVFDSVISQHVNLFVHVIPVKLIPLQASVNLPRRESSKLSSREAARQLDK